MAYIDQPNELEEDCNYISQGIFLEGTLSRLGLPIMMYYEVVIGSYDGYAGGNKTICLGDEVELGDTSFDTTNLTFL
jgi:hypothetical protein